MQETAGEFVYFVKMRQRTYSSQAKFTDGFLSGFTPKLLAVRMSTVVIASKKSQ